MRITEARLLQISTRGVDRAKTRVGQASGDLSSGVRVNRPSDDPTAWIDAMRARTRKEVSSAHGQAIARAQDRLSESEQRLQEMMDIMAMAHERSVMLANETHDANARQLGAEELRVVRDRMLSLLNARGTDGEYLFAGSRSDQAPFSAQGVYQGDTNTRVVGMPDGGTIPMSIAGNELTSQFGVDMLGAMDNLMTALSANDVQAIRGSMTEVKTGFEQLSGIMRRLGARGAALEDADTAREDLELQLDTIYSDRVATDPVAAAMDLKQAQSVLEASRIAIQQIVDMTRVA